MLGNDLTKYRIKSNNLQRGDSIIAFPDDYVCIDIETTGLHPRKNKITEVCVYEVNNRKVRHKYKSLFNPQIPIPPFITKINGINDNMVKNSPPIEDCLPEVRERISNLPILGHYVIFDIKFLNYNFGKNDIILALNDYIDTWRISKKMVRGLESYKLSSISDYFHVKTPTHRAEADVQSTIGCFEKMRKKWEEDQKS